MSDPSTGGGANNMLKCHADTCTTAWDAYLLSIPKGITAIGGQQDLAKNGKLVRGPRLPIFNSRQAT